MHKVIINQLAILEVSKAIVEIFIRHKSLLILHCTTYTTTAIIMILTYEATTDGYSKTNNC